MDETSCPINIDAAGQRARRISGYVTLGFAVAIGLYMVYADAPRWARFAVGPPLLFGFLGVLQAQRKTCVVLAAQNRRNLGHGIEKVDSVGDAAQLRQQGMSVFVMSLALAAFWTVGFWIFP